MLASVRVAAKSKPDVRFVGVFQPEKEGASPTLDAPTKRLDEDGSIAGAMKKPECTGEAGAVCEAPGAGRTRTFVIGLGRKTEFEARSLFDSTPAIAQVLARLRAGSAAFHLEGPVDEAGVDAEMVGRALGEGLALLAFDVEAFKGSASTTGKRPRVSVSAPDKRINAGLKRGVGLGESANVARMLSQTPPNICTPAWVAAEAKKLSRKHESLSVRVLKGAQLEKEKMTGLINVGKASENEPMLIRIEYTPGSVKKGAETAVLIGKTMTYDSGGLSIKVGGGMRGMKRDMDGGAAVLGAMHAIATVIKPRRRVVALLAAAENSISDEAYRPDDVLTFRNGVTVEVTNTDAEGRLVMADALCWACDKEKPGFIVDMATLTGGVVVALGSTYAGLWCDDEDLLARINAAAERSGEAVWRLPLHREYRDMMKSECADIWNSAPVRKAHPIQGAAFLSYFVEDGTPWAHIDIAGVHAHEGDKGPYQKGTATGYGVRLLAELLGA